MKGRRADNHQGQRHGIPPRNEDLAVLLETQQRSPGPGEGVKLTADQLDAMSVAVQRMAIGLFERSILLMGL